MTTIFFATLTITAVIGIAGILYPKSVAHWGGFLLTGLIALIVCQFGAILLASFGYPVQFAFTALDWVGVFIFSLYIFYDMNQAVRAEFTTRNALTFAVGMYLNIINLFLRLLSLFGTRTIKKQTVLI
ncbi:US12 family protein [bacterium]|nr:MAG: US12 family protein [bacterium]